MNCLYVLSFVLALAVHGDATHPLCASPQEGTTDICTAVKDPEYLKNLLECFLDGINAKCTPVDLNFKEELIKNVPTLCAYCDENLKKDIACLIEAVKKAEAGKKAEAVKKAEA